MKLSIKLSLSIKQLQTLEQSIDNIRTSLSTTYWIPYDIIFSLVPGQLIHASANILTPYTFAIIIIATVA